MRSPSGAPAPRAIRAPRGGAGARRLRAAPRAGACAGALGMRVVRLLPVTEGVGYGAPPPVVMMRAERGGATGAADSKMDPGEEQLQVTGATRGQLRGTRRAADD